MLLARDPHREALIRHHLPERAEPADHDHPPNRRHREVPAVDRQGSILALTDGTGNVTHVFDNDAFGVPLDTSSEPLPFGYAGELRDKELGGLVYLRSRHYLSLVGRFTSRDSFGGYINSPQSQNRYTYAENNPVNRTDPSGYGDILNPYDCSNPIECLEKGGSGPISGIGGGGSGGGNPGGGPKGSKPPSGGRGGGDINPGGGVGSEPYGPKAPSGGSSGRSLGDVTSTPELFRLYLRSKFPADKPLSYADATTIWNTAKQYGYEPRFDPSGQRGQYWKGPHINIQTGRNVHIPVEPGWSPP